MSIFKSLFSQQSQPLLGIDLGASSIKIVELGQDKKTGGISLTAFAMEPIERGLIVDGNIEKIEHLAEKIQKLLKKHNIKTRHVALALPASAAITKRLTLPLDMNDLDMEEQVKAQASQYIPFPLDEVSLDFCVIGVNANSDTEVDVLLAAARKEKVQDLQAVAEAAGLIPKIVDVASYASRFAALRHITKSEMLGTDSVSALFEIGGSTTSLQIIQGANVIYERDQAFGGAHLTQNISRYYGLTLEEAELKKINGDLPNDYASQILTPFMESLLQELNRALQFFYTSSSHNKMSHVYLSGGGSVLPNLAEYVAHSTGFKCNLINPFEDMLVNPNLKLGRLSQDFPLYLTACGLALRRFQK